MLVSALIALLASGSADETTLPAMSAEQSLQAEFAVLDMRVPEPEATALPGQDLFLLALRFERVVSLRSTARSVEGDRIAQRRVRLHLVRPDSTTFRDAVAGDIFCGKASRSNRLQPNLGRACLLDADGDGRLDHFFSNLRFATDEIQFFAQDIRPLREPVEIQPENDDRPEDNFALIMRWEGIIQDEVTIRWRLYGPESIQRLHQMRWHDPSIFRGGITLYEFGHCLRLELTETNRLILDVMQTPDGPIVPYFSTERCP